MKFDKYIYPLVAMALVLLWTLVFFRIRGIYPFGDKMILVWDMEGQYMSLMMWFRNVLHGETPFWFTLNGGLGISAIGTYAYYLASPLNLFLFFLDGDTLSLGITILIVVKMMLSAATMQLCLYSRRNSVWSICFGCFYALTTYMIAYQFNSMWMDAYYLLPLIILGLDKLINDGKFLLYSISLGLCVWANYYIAFMVCFFCVLYVCVWLLVYWNKYDGKYKLALFLRFGLFSALGGGLAFGMVLPGVLTLGGSSSGRVLSLLDLLDFSLRFSPFREITYLWAGSFDEGQGILGQQPMIYAGVLTVFAVIAFFASKYIDKKEKIFYGSLLVLLWIGFLCKGPYLLWHGAIMPSGCSNRQTFIYLFVILTLAFDVIEHISLADRRMITIGIVLSLGLFIATIAQCGFRYSYAGSILILILCIAIVIFLNDFNERRKSKYLCSVSGLLLIILFAFEFLYNANYVHERLYTDIYSSHEMYKASQATYNEISKSINGNMDNSRVVVLNGLGRSHNKGYQYGINSINQYCSTENMNTWNVYYNLGMGEVHWESDLEYESNTPALVADLLGVKYVMDESFRNTWGYDYVAETDDMKLLSNSDALPLGFLVGADASNIGYENLDGKLFDRLNDLYACVWESDGAEVYSVYAQDTHSLDNIPDYAKTKLPQIFKLEEGIYTDGNNIASEDSETISDTMIHCAKHTLSIWRDFSDVCGEFDVPETDEQLYACFSIPFDENIRAKVDGHVIDAIAGMGGMILIPVNSGNHIVTIHYSIPGLHIGIVVSILSVIVLIALSLKKATFQV